MKNLFLSLSLIGAAALVGCSKTETPAPAAPAEPAAAAAPAAPASQWPELRVAIDPTYKPFTYKTEAGEPAGFDVDVAKALCDELKSKCVFVEQAWDGMIPGLQAKKYDAIISSMSITEERKQAVDFTGKYYNTPSCVVVKSALNLGAEAANFKGKKIGVLKASTQEKYAMGELQPAGATIVPYDAQDQVYLDIKSGRLDGTVADVVEVNGGFLSTPDGKDYACAGTRIPVEFDAKYFGAGAGVAIRKEDTALRDALNAGIKAIRDSGKWKELAEKHVPGVDIWGS
ncbi:transporter substrate-binding domain-containing protein [Hydrogenophaga taeniospiralis]|jgi:arginine/ornithine transport system substrate-binding protein|uniref:transporter substrate-binding domain-containing protein n=1 Tax=Hydrogenophaga taeniospiralis TaxID=65656 RepID=UPI000CC709A4|nr:transporter substrate-binding domain-containing protein [Hydrogenophaga taeniospiralis]MDZ4300247.1 transporter substrate-binding domain-containing protein [Pseudomonas sp.]PKO75498.1 MAG: ABC transporter substrate-binding protein [Betaproteobacteria bacterium HGW-Betaproteobacteria-15]UCU96758.1 transporter substrate-binding domain-containing protein [Hydrogenophaga taeniospiralis]